MWSVKQQDVLRGDEIFLPAGKFVSSDRTLHYLRLQPFILQGSSSRHKLFRGRWHNRMIQEEAKHSILQGCSWSSGSKELSVFRKFLKLTRFSRPLPHQEHISSKTGWETLLHKTQLPKRSRNQLGCLEEAQINWATWKGHPSAQQSLLKAG